jgi:hypothetical protein
MINFRIYQILSTFSEKDWNDFSRFVKSSDVISRRKYLPLFSELKKYRKRLKTLENIPASEIFGKAYKKTSNNNTISVRQSEFLSLLKKFLVNLNKEKNNLLETYHYFDELLSRNLTNIFSYEYNRKKNTIENNYYDENSYKILSQIIGEYSVLNSEINNKDNIEASLKYLDIVLAEILSVLYKNGCEVQMLSYYELIKNNFILDFINLLNTDIFFEELEKHNKPIFIIPIIHYYIFKTLSHIDCKKYITKAKKIYFENENSFPEEFKLYIYGKIMSYYIIKINKGEMKYFKDLFLLYKRKLEQNLVSDLSEHYFVYNNVFCEYVIVGLKEKQYEWVEMVIEKYSPLLPEDIREDEYTLAMIRLHFAKKEYKKIIEITKSRKIQNQKHYLDFLRFKLMSYYELEEFEECYKEIDNGRHYYKSNRNKVLKGRISVFKNFLDGFSKLLNYRVNPYNKKVNNIYYELEELGFSKEEWTYKKLKEISKDNN